MNSDPKKVSLTLQIVLLLTVIVYAAGIIVASFVADDGDKFFGFLLGLTSLSGFAGGTIHFMFNALPTMSYKKMKMPDYKPKYNQYTNGLTVVKAIILGIVATLLPAAIATAIAAANNAEDWQTLPLFIVIMAPIAWGISVLLGFVVGIIASLAIGLTFSPVIEYVKDRRDGNNYSIFGPLSFVNLGLLFFELIPAATLASISTDVPGRKLGKLINSLFAKPDQITHPTMHMWSQILWSLIVIHLLLLIVFSILAKKQDKSKVANS